MRASTRRWSLVSVLVLSTVLAGCGSGVDTKKVSFPRETVPAGEEIGPGGGDETKTETGGGTAAPKSGDDAFTSENLRLVDPCELMGKDVLAAFGEPAENRLRDYVLCSNYMKTPAGVDLNLTLTVGELVSSGSKDKNLTVGGLPALQSELDDKSACFITALTEKNPDRGITVQTGGKATDQCDPGRKLLEAVVNRIRSGATPLAVVKGSMAELKPCEVVDAAVITSAMGEAADGRPTGLHLCNWSARGVSMSLQFKLGYKPEDLKDAAKTKEVDLGGGVTGYQESNTSSGARCELEWTHVPYPPDTERAEVVSIDFSRYEPKAGEDPCAQVMTLAKAVLPKLPAK
ncbi:MAG: DUF3558 domain-containing protein [Actinomycetota bacterium]|nr:DUF3558 domain-containing protein [Actinomycetota bacterium]